MQQVEPLAEYPAELYKALHRGNPGDVEFYQGIANTFDSVLELGCGYGRILLELGGPEKSLYGLETHSGLLQLARKELRDGKNVRGADVELVQANMCDFDLHRKFDCIIIPYNGLYCCQNERELRSSLRCVRHHLQDNGRLVFDVYAADDFHENAEGERYDDETIEHVGLVEASGVIYSVYESSQWWKEEQKIEVRYLYVPSEDNECASKTPIETRICHRYLQAAQICKLLNEAGFDSVVFHGDYAGAPYNDDSELLVVSATVVRDSRI